MPNTDYSDNRERFGFITTRADRNDFEYPIAHKTMSIADNQRMQRFLFWARTMAEALFFREIFRALRVLAGISQSEILLNMAEFFDRCEAPSARALQWDDTRTIDGESVAERLRDLYRDPAVAELFELWWEESMEAAVPSDVRVLACEIFRYDQLTRPIYDSDHLGLPRATVDGFETHVRRDVEFMFDMNEVLSDLRIGKRPSIETCPTTVDIHLRTGFHQHLDSHEVTVAYVGRILPAPARRGDRALGPTGARSHARAGR